MRECKILVLKKNKLINQLEQTRLQEEINSSSAQFTELSVPGNTPSFGEIQNKIEQRYATALGSAELASESAPGRMIEIEQANHTIQGQSRLEQIKAEMKSKSVSNDSSAVSDEASNVVSDRLNQLRN